MAGRIYDATWGRAFALGYDFFFQRAERAGLRELRRRALAGASGKTLEIGAGTGLNHDLYPPAVTELTLTEPFEPMARQLREKASALTVPVEVIETPAEALPFPDDSFDTAVLTLVLCTVPEPDRALAEIARVLKPGGRFLFLEHVRAPDPGLARWQDRLAGPWRAFGHGCNCNRDTLATIERSELEVERAERGEFPKMPPLVKPMLIGAAIVGSPPRTESRA
ncbi:MAG TPA: class I SAM-dependent methyltransferase [Thermoleophilaceae bacterium]|nr:class I SAM-dependent methyltransferase [Thermoleophilaceae bacterium]